jgi:hypothetical protein
MHGAENRRRRRRPAMTTEELATLIEYKKRLERMKLAKFKQTSRFRIYNIFNIICAFIYFEIVFCYFGPAAYERHYSTRLTPHFGQDAITQKPIVTDIEILTTEGREYRLVLNENISVPPVGASFVVGKEFLLRKDLKAKFERGLREYRLFKASPILFLSMIVLVISVFSFVYNLNENPYSLMALTVLNLLNMTGILLY